MSGIMWTQMDFIVFFNKINKYVLINYVLEKIIRKKT